MLLWHRKVHHLKVIAYSFLLSTQTTIQNTSLRLSRTLLRWASSLTKHAKMLLERDTTVLMPIGMLTLLVLSMLRG